MKFTEAQLESAVISLLEEQDISYTSGLQIHKKLEEIKGLLLGEMAVEK